jgi:hypothetical protein
MAGRDLHLGRRTLPAELARSVNVEARIRERREEAATEPVA